MFQTCCRVYLYALQSEEVGSAVYHSHDIPNGGAIQYHENTMQQEYFARENAGDLNLYYINNIHAILILPIIIM